jgi:fatty acid elongase 3
MGQCAGEEFAAFAGIGIITSYLLLFISFYIATYNKAAKVGRPRSNTGKKSLIDMKNFEVPSPAGAANGSANGSAKGSNGSASSTGRSNGPVTRSRKA